MAKTKDMYEMWCPELGTYVYSTDLDECARMFFHEEVENVRVAYTGYEIPARALFRYIRKRGLA